MASKNCPVKISDSSIEANRLYRAIVEPVSMIGILIMSSINVPQKEMSEFHRRLRRLVENSFHVFPRKFVAHRAKGKTRRTHWQIVKRGGDNNDRVVAFPNKEEKTLTSNAVRRAMRLTKAKAKRSLRRPKFIARRDTIHESSSSSSVTSADDIRETRNISGIGCEVAPLVVAPQPPRPKKTRVPQIRRVETFTNIHDELIVTHALLTRNVFNVEAWSLLRDNRYDVFWNISKNAMRVERSNSLQIWARKILILNFNNNWSD